MHQSTSFGRLANGEGDWNSLGISVINARQQFDGLVYFSLCKLHTNGSRHVLNKNAAQAPYKRACQGHLHHPDTYSKSSECSLKLASSTCCAVTSGTADWLHDLGIQARGRLHALLDSETVENQRLADAAVHIGAGILAASTIAGQQAWGSQVLLPRASALQLQPSNAQAFQQQRHLTSSPQTYAQQPRPCATLSIPGSNYERLDAPARGLLDAVALHCEDPHLS